MTSFLRRKWKLCTVFTVLLVAVALTVGLNYSAYAKYTEKIASNTQMTVSLMNEPGTLLPNSTWYKTATEKGAIEEICFVKELPQDVTFQEQWDASVTQDNRITAAISGSTLYISSNGTDIIYANAQSNQAFSEFANVVNIKGLEMLDSSKIVEMNQMFAVLQSLQSIDLSHFDTSNVQSMQSVFLSCFALENIDISGFDMSNVTSVRAMFQACTNLETIKGIENLVTEKTTDTAYLFMDCYALQMAENALSNWNTSNVETMERMFSSSSKISALDLSSWDTSSLKNIKWMFYNDWSLQKLDVTGWDTSHVEDMSHFLQASTTLTKVDGFDSWDTSAVKDMQGMFNACFALTVAPSGFDTSSVTNMASMFAECRALETLDLSAWDVSQVQDFSLFLNSCLSLKELNIDWEEASDIATTTNMFNTCNVLQKITVGSGVKENILSVFPVQENHNISGADGKWYSESTGTGYAPSEIPENKADIYYASKELLPLSDFVLAPSSSWYKGTTPKDTITEVQFVTELPSGQSFSEQWDASEAQNGSVTAAISGSTLYVSSNGMDCIYANPDSHEMFGDYDIVDTWDNLVAIKNASLLNTYSVTTMKDMFAGCLALTEIDVSTWNTSDVEDMSEMFLACFALETVDVSNWDTGNVKNMAYMFSNSNLLRPIGIENWDTHNLEDASYMFMPSLAAQPTDAWSLDLSNWNTSKLTNVSNMLSRMDITEVDLSGWDTSSIQDADGMFTSVQRITVGNKVGTIVLRELPVYTDAELAGADGKWYAESDGAGYAPSEIPGNKADTYYASSALLPAINPSTLAAGATWYKGTIDKSEITEVRFVRSLPSGVSFDELWDAAEKIDESVPVAIDGTVLYISSNGTDKVLANANSNYLFEGFKALESIDNLAMLDTSMATSFEGMFANCSNLKEINVSSFNTSNVSNFRYVFSNCVSLTALDLSSFDMSKGTDITALVENCANLNYLNIAWNDTSKVSLTGGFYYCFNIRTLVVSENVSAAILVSIPSPNSNYIPGADGKWYAASNGVGYTPSELPAGVADTYYALNPQSSGTLSNELHDEVQNSSVTNSATSSTSASSIEASDGSSATTESDTNADSDAAYSSTASDSSSIKVPTESSTPAAQSSQPTTVSDESQNASKSASENSESNQDVSDESLPEDAN